MYIINKYLKYFGTQAVFQKVKPQLNLHQYTTRRLSLTPYLVSELTQKVQDR